MTKPEWKQFEVAVAKLVASLDPQATVRQNVHLPDVDTGQLRQRDVWVEAKVSGHYPIKVLISCKRWSRKLNVEDIDHFIGECRSSGAHLGVLYSYLGYTKTAIKKAKKLGICCCRLYTGQPPDIPDSLPFQSYCCIPQISVMLVEKPDPAWCLIGWNDLFDIEMGEDDKTLLDHIVATFYEGESKAFSDSRRKGEFLPSDLATKIEIPEKGRSPLKITLRLIWQIYRAKFEAHLLDGSYVITSDDFKGTQLGPVIDLRGPSPGPGWDLLDRRPSELENRGMVIILQHGNVKEALQQQLGPEPL